MNTSFVIEKLQSGGLITNYYCSSSCRHCLYRCSPHWPKNYCTPAKVLQIFKKMYQTGCTSIHIGGGEPFLDVNGLLDILKIAKQTGIRIEYIETNSSWFNNGCEHQQLLETLRNLDVPRLLVSMSPFHNEFIPFYKVKSLINACNNHNIQISGWMWEFFGDIEQLTDEKAHSLEEYESLFGEYYIEQISKNYCLKPGGRALELYTRIDRGTPLQVLLSRSEGGCAEITDTSHFHIDLFGNYIPGLCAGLSIRMEDLGKKLDMRSYPILTRLQSEGINGLFDYVRDVYGFETRKSSYISKCELCYEIRSFLINEEKILSHETRPYEHYTI